VAKKSKSRKAKLKPRKAKPVKKAVKRTIKKTIKHTVKHMKKTKHATKHVAKHVAKKHAAPQARHAEMAHPAHVAPAMPVVPHMPSVMVIPQGEPIPPTQVDRVHLQTISFEISGMKRTLERMLSQLERLEADISDKRREDEG